MLRATGETETTQENIQDWLELGEGDTEFHPLTEEEICCSDFFIYFHQHYLSHSIFHLFSF
jgi:hypothetical protein